MPDSYDLIGGKNKLSAIFLRTKLLIGNQAFEKLKNSKVAIFGIGGVGSYTAEALARSGVGAIDIFDGDFVELSNINRQIVALISTIGEAKTEIMKKRMIDINPEISVNAFKIVFDASNAENYSFQDYDYIVDAIDMVSSKLLIISKAKSLGKNVISSMGTGNKINPSMLEIGDIYSTSVCPLARVMRRELKARKINSLKVVYSKEKPIYTPPDKVNASISFVPSVAGLLIAGEVVKDLIDRED